MIQKQKEGQMHSWPFCSESLQAFWSTPHPCVLSREMVKQLPVNQFSGIQCSHFK